MLGYPYLNRNLINSYYIPSAQNTAVYACYKKGYRPPDELRLWGSDSGADGPATASVVVAGDCVVVTFPSGGGCASATREGPSMVADAAGACETGLDAGAEIPDAGRAPPKARPSLVLILFNVRSPTDQPPSSLFSLLARCLFSFLNLLNASIRSSGVAWRIRPMWRTRERRLWRVSSAFRASFGERD